MAGTFRPTDETYRRADRAEQLNARLLERAQRVGAVRPDLAVDDLSFLFEQPASVRAADEQRTRQLRHRYLALLLDALRGRPGATLPGPRPTWEEISARWGTGS
jgi:hypothetical protein